MKKVLLSLAVLLALLTSDVLAQAVPTAPTFNYQGQLIQDDRRAHGSFDFQFQLFDDPEFGSAISSLITVEDVDVDTGLFTVDLDFGTGLFDGTTYWIAIGVREGSSTGTFAALSPRQKLTAAPYALFAYSGNQGPQGPAGPEGPEGPSGPEGSSGGAFSVDGQDATFTGGNVGIGAPSSGAALTIRGTFSQPLTGLVTVGGGLTTVSGSSTSFMTELSVGDPIIIEGEAFTVAEITDSAELILSSPHSAGALNATAYTGNDLVHIEQADGTQKIRVDRNANLRSESRIVGSCPANYTAVNDEYCIETDENAAGPSGFYDAIVQCANENAHLCSEEEFHAACVILGANLLNFFDDWEWISERSNALAGFLDTPEELFSQRGHNTCSAATGVTDPTAGFAFRCCAHR